MNTSASLGGVAEAWGAVEVPASADFYRLGLAGCIDRLTGPLRRQGTCVHWETPRHGLEISASCASLLYRSAQEALNNAFRHAHATDVTVRLTAVFHGIRLTIADNGNGFGQRSTDRTGPDNASLLASTADDGDSGLRTMSAAIQDAGGTVAISSEPGAGTEVTVTIPLD